MLVVIIFCYYWPSKTFFLTEEHIFIIIIPVYSMYVFTELINHFKKINFNRAKNKYTMHIK